jgi:RHS repeat-associated protein
MKISTLLAALLCALPLFADSRNLTFTYQINGGTVTYSIDLIANGQSSLNWGLMLTPDVSMGSNHAEITCTGAGIQPYVGATSVTGVTMWQIPVRANTGSFPPAAMMQCAINFSNFPAIDFPTSMISATVYPTAFPYSSTNAENQQDPVSTATGELFGSFPPDLALGGPMNLQFSRYYGSLINSSGVLSRIGTNWMHNFEWIVTLTSGQATVTRFGGEVLVFTLSGGSYQLATPERYGYQFAKVAPNTYQFLDPSTKLLYTFTGTANTLGISSIQDRNGNQLLVNAGANQFTVIDNLGRGIQINYDPQTMNVASVSDSAGRTVSYTYTGGNLTGFVDANGHKHTYAYTSANGVAGLLTGETRPLGNTPYTSTFDNLGRVATQADSSGNATAFTYDQPSGTVSWKDPLGIVFTDTNQNYSNLLSHTDPDKQSLTVTYDANGRRTSVTDRLGNKISVTYHSPSGYVASETDALGNTTTYTWTAQSAQPFTYYVLSKVTFADNTSISYTYDTNGNVLTATDQSGNVSKYTYNSLGLVLTSTDADGHTTTYAYNADATLASMTDGAGNKTTYSYDGAKRVSQVRLPDGNTLNYTYDNLNNLTKSVSETGSATTYAYDANENLLNQTDGNGHATLTKYNSQDLVQSVTDRVLNTTKYAYDQNNALQSVTLPAGEVYSVTRNTHHQIATTVDPAGNSTVFGYDKEDGLTSVTDPLSRTTLLKRDAHGNVTKITTPSGAVFTNTFDHLNRLLSQTDGAGIVTSAAFDARGLETSLTVGPIKTQLSRDGAGFLTGLTDPNGNTWTNTFDSASRLGSVTDPLKRTTKYSYNSRSQISNVTLPLGSGAFTYSPTGSLLTAQFSDGTTFTFTTDPVTGLSGATGLTLSRDAGGNIIASNGLATTRDADNRIASITYATNKTVTYTYNPAGLLSTVADWINGTTTFTYDAAGQLTGMKRANGTSTQYTYSPDGAIASISESAGLTINVQRDGAGKVTSESRSPSQLAALAPGSLPLSYDAAEQLSSGTYDANGRITQDTLRMYTWNLANQLTAYTGADGAANATYDAYGLRTSASNSTGTLNYVWNYATPLASLAVVRNSSGDQRYYVYLPDGTLLYAIDAGTNARHFYHFDEYGSTTLLTDDTGAITDAYGITPYGETVTQNGSTANPFTWQGQMGVMQEGSTSLFYMRARWYDSATARFLSPDPVASASPLEVNPYQYARGNPTLFDDPTGLDCGSKIEYVKVVSTPWGRINVSGYYAKPRQLLQGFRLPGSYEDRVQVAVFPGTAGTVRGSRPWGEFPGAETPQVHGGIDFGLSGSAASFKLSISRQYQAGLPGPLELGAPEAVEPREILLNLKLDDLRSYQPPSRFSFGRTGRE